VTFAVVDMNGSDDAFEVIAPEFFNKRVCLYSVRRGSKEGSAQRLPEVVFSRVIDDDCGNAYGIGLMPSSGGASESEEEKNIIIDGGGTDKGSLGDAARPTFSHVIVSNHERSEEDNTRESNNNNSISSTGGQLFSYSVPNGGNWKTSEWTRSTIESSIPVRSPVYSLNPGAPGFPLVFKPDLEKEEWLIGLAGDGAEMAYVYRPVADNEGGVGLNYELMVSVAVGCTVGSLAVHHGEIFDGAKGKIRMANLAVNCHERNMAFMISFDRGA